MMIVRNILIVFLFSVTCLPVIVLSAQENMLPSGKTLNSALLNLKPNTWIKFHESSDKSWHRQAHAGIAYDTKRGTLLVFGSNTHGNDWDNSVHEFDPFEGKWITHYPASPKNSYRIDKEGYAIAGTDKLRPWAMHTYDNIVYDPSLDALIVTALPEHNPIKKKFRGQKIVHPTWLYDLKTHTWKIFQTNDGKFPKLFASATEYDSRRKIIVAYKSGIWELEDKGGIWTRATRERHHKIHFSMEFVPSKNKFFIFGDHGFTNTVWTYAPGNKAGEKGIWEELQPEGDKCPEDQHIPVAYDPVNNVFLLIVNNNRFKLNKKGNKRSIGAKSSSTFIYDINQNKYIRIRNSNMPTLKMNYMMAYDHAHKVFFLITGKRNKPVVVWTMKLDKELIYNR